MNIVRRFRNVWKFFVPGWLQTGQGELILFVQGVLKDAFAEASHQTALLQYPSTCPSDALGMHGRSRALPRGLFEPEENYRLRLAGWRYPEGHRTRGTAGALLAQFQIALRGTHHVIIDARNKRTVAGSGAALPSTWTWDATPASQWGRYWLVCKSIGSLPLTWDQDDANGTLWDEDDACWAGEGIHVGEIAAVREITSNRRLGWTPAGVRGVNLVIYFGNSFPAPTGNWDLWANRPSQDYAFEPLNAAYA